MSFFTRSSFTMIAKKGKRNSMAKEPAEPLPDFDSDDYNLIPEEEDCEDELCSVSKEDLKQFEDEADIESCMKIASSFRLPTNEELEDGSEPLVYSKLLERINKIFKVLSVFELLMEEKPTHKDYVDQVVTDLSSYYGYNKFTVEAVMEMLDVMETKDFFFSLEKQPDTCIRTNTLKTNREDLLRALSRKQIECKPIYEWSNVGLAVYSSEFHLSTSTEYINGLFTIQRASSFLPVMALDPQKHEKIAEMWAAPGDRTTYIAALMENTGTIYSNVMNTSSTSLLSENLMRMGVTNTKVYNCDVTEAANFMGKNVVDRVLLSAPSSNTGIITNAVVKKTSKEDILKCAMFQKQLLLAAVDMVDADSKSGGYIVYSTSSIMVEENEAVIDFALKNRNVRLMSSGLVSGRPGFIHYKGDHFHPDLEETRRFYPHLNKIDGLFVAKLKKISDSKRTAEPVKEVEETATLTENNGNNKGNGDGQQQHTLRVVQRGNKIEPLLC